MNYLRFTHQLSFTTVYQVELVRDWCPFHQKWELMEGNQKWGHVELGIWWREQRPGWPAWLEAHE